MRRYHSVGPFGVDEEDAEYEEVVDGQVVSHMGAGPSVVRPPPGVTVLGAEAQPKSAPQPSASQQSASPYTYGQGGAVPSELADELLALALDQRSRALALFFEVPFCAVIALHPELPGLIRLGAAALGVVRTAEVLQRQKELESYLPQMPEASY